MQKVRVYWNLHKKTWSVQDCKSGLVIDHKQHLSLLDAKFVVRKGGQKRVRQEGKKNVHAFAVGYIMNDDELDFENFTLICDAWNRVKYNPYNDDYFMRQSLSDNQYKLKEWSYIPRDWVGSVRMESTQNGNPKVYI